jgi:hypothetical protein
MPDISAFYTAYLKSRKMPISGLNPDPPADIAPASRRELGAHGRARRRGRLAPAMAANAPPGRPHFHSRSRPPPEDGFRRRSGIAACRRVNPRSPPGRDNPATTGDP